MDKGSERIKASYNGNYGRLKEIKTEYDPDKFLPIKRNILLATEDN